MKRFVKAAVVAVAVAMAACATNVKELTWGTETLPAPAGLIPGDSIEVSWPVASGSTAADSINLSIGEALTSLVGYGEDWMPGVPFSARIDSLLSERNEDTCTHVREMPYQIQIDGQVKQFGHVASVRLISYVFQGGAHGLGLETCLNFDSRTGRKLTLTELVADTTRLGELNKIAFSEHFGDDLAELPLFVTVEALPLPQNIGIDSTGLAMHYNPYEIAPYYVGPTDYLLPMEEVGALLNPAMIK